MKQAFIDVLETICPNNVFLQGTLNPNEAYPDSFITFWTNYTDDNKHYDNDVHSIDWDFTVNYYSNDPALVDTVPMQIRTALKNAGFIPQGKGNDLPSDVVTHTGWTTDYIKTEYQNKKPYKISKIAPYFYEAEFEDIDYRNAMDFFAKYKPVVGACSAVRNGNFFGRNYDWTYDERCSFVVSTPAGNGRHSVLGIAAGTRDLTQDFVDSKSDSESYKIVPFMLLDGINDAGLICEINVVPTGDKGYTKGTNAQEEDLFAVMIPRYVLDYATNVDEAIRLLENRNIFCPDNSGLTQEYHFMIADAEKTVVIEFVENEMVVIDQFVDDKPISTNLYLDGYDGTRESLTPYAMGIERQAILNSNYILANSEIGMLALMQLVQYTKTYDTEQEQIWYSEFCGDWGDPWGNLTKDSLPEDYMPLINHMAEVFADRQRDGRTWQTVHASVYNISEKKVVVIPQESGEMYSFTMKRR